MAAALGEWLREIVKSDCGAPQYRGYPERVGDNELLARWNRELGIVPREVNLNEVNDSLPLLRERYLLERDDDEQ
jgi:hypothetical protein